MSILIKRGLSANLPATLLSGEPAFATDTGKFYIGTGSSKTLINPDGGQASTADKLTTPRTISTTGDATVSVTFDGSANASGALTLSTVATAGTYKSVTVNAKGLVTAGTNPTTLSGYGITDGAPLASPALTGTPTAPTATAGTNTTQLSTTAFVMTAIANLVASSPATLDTLNEIAIALGNDPNFATTITNLLALKAPLASPALTGAPTAPTATTGTNTTQLATTAFVNASIATIDGGTF